MNNNILSNVEINKADIYTDMNGLHALKRGAKEKDPQAIHAAAQQFESIFMQNVLKSMRAANEGFKSGILDSNATEFYENMQDQQMALTLTKGDGVGLSKVIEKQLTPHHARMKSDALGSNAAFLALSDREKGTWLGRAEEQPWYSEIHTIKNNIAEKSLVSTSSEIPALNPISNHHDNEIISELPGIPGAKKSPRFTSREDFVKAMLPHALEISEKLGMDPRVLISQAALETNWGRSIIQAPDGMNSHNLFGIKANKAWDGDKVVTATHEFYNGRKVKEQAAFRSYDSYQHSFSDYVNFLQNNKRYENVFKQVDGPASFAGALQHAGYATDPYYAKKIMSIYHSEPMKSVSL